MLRQGRAGQYALVGKCLLTGLPELLGDKATPSARKEQALAYQQWVVHLSQIEAPLYQRKFQRFIPIN